MKTFKAFCLEFYSFAIYDREWTLERGREYIISEPSDDGTVTVFSSFWVPGVPVSLFGGLVPGPGER